MDIRKLIVASAKTRGLTRYGLWRAVRPTVSKMTVFNYWTGKSDMTGEHLQRLLVAVGLTVVPLDRVIAKPMTAASEKKAKAVRPSRRSGARADILQRRSGRRRRSDHA